MKLGLKVILSIILVFVFFLFLLVTFEKIHITSKQDTLEVVIENEKVREKVKFQLTTQQITLCNILFTPPWFVVYNPDGSYLMIIDSRGNLFINSTIQQNTLPNQTGWRNAFIIRNSTGTIVFAVNRTIGQIRGSIYENSSTFPTNNSFIVRNSTHILAAFNSSFFARGKIVYNGYNDPCYNRIFCNSCINEGGVCNYRCWNGQCNIFCDRGCWANESYSCEDRII